MHAHTVARMAVGGGRPTISLSFDSRGNREVERTRRPKGERRACGALFIARESSALVAREIDSSHRS